MKQKKSLKPDDQMLRGVVYGLIESFASMGHSSIRYLICTISVCNKLTVSVHLSSTPSISGPGSSTAYRHVCREGAQWLSGRALDSRLKGRGFEPHRRHCVVSLSKNINPSLVLVQPRKTRPFITERLLMGRKESNQTKQNLGSLERNRYMAT